MQARLERKPSKPATIDIHEIHPSTHKPKPILHQPSSTLWSRDFVSKKYVLWNGELCMTIQPRLPCGGLGWVGETSRYRYGSYANVFALRCICGASVSLSEIPSGQSSSPPPFVCPEIAYWISPAQSLVRGRRWGSVQSYLMVLPVRRRIHCGIGLFCFWALASLTFVRKDLWLCWRSSQYFVACNC